MEPERVVLYIDTTSSECGACGKPADPYEQAHVTRLGWTAANAPEDSPLRKGCGATFTHLSTHYSNFDDLYEHVRQMRPDLEWIGGMGDPFSAPELRVAQA